MNMEFIRKLPIPKELKAQFSLSEKLVNVKAKRDAEIKKVFTGESDKKLLIIGPCSADREDAVLDYVSRLAKVQENVKSAVQNMTNVTVSRVDLVIAGLAPAAEPQA